MLLIILIWINIIYYFNIINGNYVLINRTHFSKNNIYFFSCIQYQTIRVHVFKSFAFQKTKSRKFLCIRSIKHNHLFFNHVNFFHVFKAYPLASVCLLEITRWQDLSQSAKEAKAPRGRHDNRPKRTPHEKERAKISHICFRVL